MWCGSTTFVDALLLPNLSRRAVTLIPLQYQFYQTETEPGYIFRPTFNFPPRFDGLPETHREESPLVDRPSVLLLAGGLPRLRRAALSAPPPTRWTILRGPSPSPLTSLGFSYFIFQKEDLRFWVDFVSSARFCYHEGIVLYRKEYFYMYRMHILHPFHIAVDF